MPSSRLEGNTYSLLDTEREIAALYRTARRAMVTDLVRQKIPPAKVDEWVVANVPENVEPQHREKFIGDVLAELKHLDGSRIAGLGITREQLEAWNRMGD